MTTTINATAEVLEKPVDADHIHYLPCSINFTGETEVEGRFRKLTGKNEETGVKTGSLRGFPLEGRTVSLPDKYQGLVLEGGKAGLTSHDRNCRVTSTFTELTYWNYDRTPGPGDAWQQAMQWPGVADIVHSD